ncbi:MAG: PEGA domain-containing protein [Bdellovibrionales bacterium]|nr:PEGA domain-containing protein [Bdellovibrionales bacterium]
MKPALLTCILALVLGVGLRADGTVEVVSTPPANVYLDGELIGQSPLTASGIPPGSHQEGVAVEDDLVVGAEVIHVENRPGERPRLGGDRFPAGSELAPLEGRRGKIDQQIGPRLHEPGGRALVVHAAPPVLLKIPGILAHEKPELPAVPLHGRAIVRRQHGRGVEVTAFVENVVIGNQRLGADLPAPLRQKHGRVHHSPRGRRGSARGRLHAESRAHHDGHVGKLLVQGALQRRELCLGTAKKIIAVEKILRRVADQGQLGKNHQLRARRRRPFQKRQRPPEILVEIPDADVDRSEGCFHSMLSCER